MAKFATCLLLLAFVGLCSAFVPAFGKRFFGNAAKATLKATEEPQYTEQGYLIKTKESGWFNGLSTNPGDSLSDPRSVPPECVAFADKVKSGAEVSFQEVIDLIDKHYFYFEVPFTNGDLVNEANTNVGSAKIFAFGLMTQMNEHQTLSMFGEYNRDLSATGDDHMNIRTFKKLGWSGVAFERGLPISSKLQAGEETDEVFATQSVNEGEGDWAMNSDSWIP